MSRKLTLKKEDVQIAIARYIKTQIAYLDVVGKGKETLQNNKIEVVATIQQPDCEYTGVGEYEVILNFMGEISFPLVGEVRVKVSSEDGFTPLISVVDKVYIKP